MAGTQRPLESYAQIERILGRGLFPAVLVHLRVDELGERLLVVLKNGDHSYEPDFVAETEDAKFLCEPKAAGEMDDPEVQEKAKAAVEWCRHATAHERQHGGKPWRYLLIPHDQIEANRTLSGLAAGYEIRPAKSTGNV